MGYGRDSDSQDRDKGQGSGQCLVRGKDRTERLTLSLEDESSYSVLSNQDTRQWHVKDIPTNTIARNYHSGQYGRAR